MRKETVVGQYGVLYHHVHEDTEKSSEELVSITSLQIYLKLGPTTYEAEILPTLPWCSVQVTVTLTFYSEKSSQRVVKASIPRQ